MTKNINGISVGVAIIVSTVIIVVVGLFFLGSRGQTNSDASADDMAGHHGAPAKAGTRFSPDALIGKPAPDFTLKDRSETTYALSNLKGKNVVLFFNEGLMCYPACWNQIVELGQDERLKRDDTVVLSVVVDRPKEWQSAIKKMPALADATVVFDTDASVSDAYGVLTAESSMHYGQFPGHTYVVIDKQGLVQHVYDDPNMAIHNDQLIDEMAKLS